MTAIRDTSSGTIRLRGVGSADDFTVTPASRTIVVGTTTTSTSFKDAALTNVSTATVDTVQDLHVGLPLNSALVNGAVQYASQSAGIATVDASGATTRVSDGTANVLVTVPGLGARRVPVAVSRSTGQTTTTFANFLSGSLGRHLVDSMAGYLNGKTYGSATTALFSTEDDATPAYVRNASLFAGAVDWTCIPAWASGSGREFLGVLVSPRHVLSCAHARTSGTIRFVKADGTVVSRTLSGSLQVGSTDICMYVLDSDVPAGINFAKVLPANYASHLPQPIYGYPCAFTNNPRRIIVADYSANGLTISKSTDSTRAQWYTPVIVGDSGSPAFVVVNGAPVAVTTWHTSNLTSTSSGPPIADNLSTINAAMTSLGGGYSLTTVDLSGFTSY